MAGEYGLRGNPGEKLGALRLLQVLLFFVNYSYFPSRMTKSCFRLFPSSSQMTFRFPICFVFSVVGGAGYHAENLKWAVIALPSPFGFSFLVSIFSLS